MTFLPLQEQTLTLLKLKILISPDKFKGSLPAAEVCKAIAGGIRQLSPDHEILEVPMADGGEGSMEIIHRQTGGHFRKTTVLDPLFRPIEASWLLHGDTAYIEMAAASGLQLLAEEERKAKRTTTYGTGELILEAIRSGATRIFLLVGGSATNDAGMGMAKALGFGFTDREGKELEGRGEQMIGVQNIRPTALDLSAVSFFVLCDVGNPFYGPEGAAHVFARQKGATDEEIRELDEGLKHMAGVFKSTFGIDVQQISGAGAAGGIAGGAVAMLGAKIQSGIHTLMEIAGLEDKIKEADLVITGEGKTDTQTLNGKVIAGVAKLAAKYQKPVLVFCGKLELNQTQLNELGITAAFAVKKEGMSVEEAMRDTGLKLETLAAEQLGKFIKPASG